MPIDIAKLKQKPDAPAAGTQGWANTFKPAIEQQLGI